jgi:2-polyprenyl-3-methyl-5-hydroxy-6-metoxy-1,4-benzoquinol methylase
MSELINSETMERAARSGGTSAGAIYALVERALKKRNAKGIIAIDLGCGRGGLQPVLEPFFRRYIGADAIRYDVFPADAEFVEADLNTTGFPIASHTADAIFAIETIEHLENPRAFVREMVRIAKPGAWIVITTPNQLSFLSLGTLLFKRRFSAFQDVHYPAHITALLECDLLRIAAEAGLREATTEFSLDGRIVLTSLHYPQVLVRLLPRLCSDNILLIGRAP